MSSRQDLLALRRHVLVARSAMLRLRAARDLHALRESLTLPGLATSLATSTRGRSALFATLLVVFGGRRFARALRFAAGALAAARLLRAVGRYMRRRGGGAEGSVSSGAAP